MQADGKRKSQEQETVLGFSNLFVFAQDRGTPKILPLKSQIKLDVGVRSSGEK